jgi:hypothetical protein
LVTSRTDATFNATFDLVAILKPVAVINAIAVVQPAFFVQPVLATIDAVIPAIQSIFAPFRPGFDASIEIGPPVLCLGVEARSAPVHVCLRVRLYVGLDSSGGSHIGIGLDTKLGAVGSGAGLRNIRLLGNRPTRHGKRQGACG